MINPNRVYRNHLEVIKNYGHNAEARGLKFKEIMSMCFHVSMQNPVITVAERKMGFVFAAAEPAWLLSGSNLLSGITAYGKMAPYSDDGYFMRGSYGPKIIDQLPYICRTLAEDGGSRQAVLNIWRERPEQSKDIPCTLSMQFMIRDLKLHTFVSMRSSDVVTGLPYDAIFFTCVSAYVLSILNHHFVTHHVVLGDLFINAGSAHIYDRDMKLVEDICSSSERDQRANDPDSHEPLQLDFNKLAKQTPSVIIELLEEWRDNPNKLGILNLADLA